MIKLLTHTDLDGFGCYFLACMAFGKENIDVEYCNYNNIEDKILNFLENRGDTDWCYITDISCSYEFASDHIEEMSKYTTIIDHHKTAFQLNDFLFANVKVYDERKGILTCGTELFYKYLVRNSYLKPDKFLYELSELIRDYDTWKWYADGNMLPKQINDLYYIYDREDFYMSLIAKQLTYFDEIELSEKDKLILNQRQREIDKYINEKDKTIIFKKYSYADNDLGDYVTYNVGVVFADRFISELGNEICLRHEDIDYCMILDVARGTISFRTVRDDIDLGKIAKEYNGGGHAKASGGKIEEMARQLFVDFVVNS